MLSCCLTFFWAPPWLSLCFMYLEKIRIFSPSAESPRDRWYSTTSGMFYILVLSPLQYEVILPSLASLTGYLAQGSPTPNRGPLPSLEPFRTRPEKWWVSTQVHASPLAWTVGNCMYMRSICVSARHMCPPYANGATHAHCVHRTIPSPTPSSQSWKGWGTLI